MFVEGKRKTYGKFGWKAKFLKEVDKDELPVFEKAQNP